MNKVAYFTNAHQYSGVGHRAHALARTMRATPNAQWDPVLFMLDGERRILSKNGRSITTIMLLPGPLRAKSISWIRLVRAAKRYIAHIDKFSYALHHFTNQTLSFGVELNVPSVVTVHDIIERIDPQDKRAALINTYLYSGIRRANAVIAVSEFTKNSILEHMDIDPAVITVIPNGVGKAFHPIEQFENTIGYQELIRELHIQPEASVLISVGSDHPRKNLGLAFKVFANVLKEYPDAVLLKVGAPGLPMERARLLELADSLGIREQIRFIQHIETSRLNELYNLADVCIFPSRFEGFGLPPLQSMAAGTPVVAADSTSIPEVTGDAAVLHDPDDEQGFSRAVIEIIESGSKAADLRQRGIEQAKKFSWERATEQVIGVYNSLL